MDTEQSSKEIEQYDSINEFVVVSEYGFRRAEGPWSVEKDGTKWTIIVPYDEMQVAFSHSDEGRGAVLIADGKAIGGGIVDAVFDPQDEGEQHVVVDQYAKGVEE